MLARQERRLPVDLADDGDVAGDDRAVLHHLDLRARDVDHDVALVRQAHRLDALDIGLQLREPHVRRNVQRLQRALPRPRRRRESRGAAGICFTAAWT